MRSRPTQPGPPTGGRSWHDPAVTIYFEDFTAGRVFEVGSVEVSEDEIIEFASRFDPQPFHTDPVAAAETPFGGIIASGWHTCSMCMRLLVDGLMSRTVSLGSPGVEQVRWLAPVRPGDRLSARTTVEDARPSSSKPTQGTVTFVTEMINQDGVTVLSMRALGMYGRRPVD